MCIKNQSFDQLQTIGTVSLKLVLHMYINLDFTAKLSPSLLFKQC